MMKRPFVLNLLLVLMIAMAISGCISNSHKSYSSHGEKLTIVAGIPQEVDRVLYTEDGKNYVISAREEGNTLALVKTRVLNQKSTQITLSIDKDAARINVKDVGDIHPLDFREMGVESSEDIPEDYQYRPFLWDRVQISHGFEINGWMIFEVPQNSKYLGFAWDNVEFVTVVYPK